MACMAVAVFIALHFVKAGYGMMYNPKWGVTISNRVGWVIMEAPVFFAMGALWLVSDRRCEIAPCIFLILFELHYFQRSFVFPLLFRSKGKMPLTVIAMGVVFNVINALMQGGWIFYISPSGMYSIDWLYSWQFVTGVVVFFFGMGVNLQSDSIIRRLRKPGDTKHYLPRGGFFKYVASANYFGEIVEWVGFAVMTWSWAGVVFALWTFANLAPRAKAIHARYAREFGEEFKKLHLKYIIPYVY